VSISTAAAAAGTKAQQPADLSVHNPYLPELPNPLRFVNHADFLQQFGTGKHTGGTNSIVPALDPKSITCCLAIVQTIYGVGALVYVCLFARARGLSCVNFFVFSDSVFAR
jgi:hypothetical protein